jgi:hypothetical protein
MENKRPKLQISLRDLNSVQDDVRNYVKNRAREVNSTMSEEEEASFTKAETALVWETLNKYIDSKQALQVEFDIDDKTAKLVRCATPQELTPGQLAGWEELYKLSCKRQKEREEKEEKRKKWACDQITFPLKGVERLRIFLRVRNTLLGWEL